MTSTTEDAWALAQQAIAALDGNPHHQDERQQRQEQASAATAHVTSCCGGRVFLLSPAFAEGGCGGGGSGELPLAAQKAELDALLDTVAAPLSR